MGSCADKVNPKSCFPSGIVMDTCWLPRFRLKKRLFKVVLKKHCDDKKARSPPKIPSSSLGEVYANCEVAVGQHPPQIWRAVVAYK